MSTVTLTNVDNGRTIEARQGDEIVLRLPENPTTGYRWHLDRDDEHLDRVADDFAPNADRQIGSGGVRELRFRPVSLGTAKLELKYWQEWEGEDSVTDRFAVEIQILA